MVVRSTKKIFDRFMNGSSVYNPNAPFSNISSVYPSFTPVLASNNTFTKQFDATELWFMTMLDHYSPAPIVDYLRASIIDSNTSVLRTWTWVVESAGGILAYSHFISWTGISAGSHLVTVDGAVNGGTSRWSSQVDIVQILEVDTTPVLVGQATASPATSTGPAVNSGFPANNSFTKQYGNSHLWIWLNMAHSNNTGGSTNSIQVSIDNGTYSQLFSNDFLVGGHTRNELMPAIFTNIPVGNHTIQVIVSTNVGTGTFFTNTADMRIQEILA